MKFKRQSKHQPDSKSTGDSSPRPDDDDDDADYDSEGGSSRDAPSPAPAVDSTTNDCVPPSAPTPIDDPYPIAAETFLKIPTNQVICETKNRSTVAPKRNSPESVETLVG